jgi:mono/diheme cytochrome c family protein
MRKFSMALMTTLALGAFIGLAAADQAPKAEDAAKAKGKSEEGKAVFQKYKCRSCHSIEALGIAKKELEGETEKTEKKPPDLSGVGLDRKADWFTLFLQKKEKLGGTLHPKKFRGTETELKKLVAWLETLKEKPAAKKEAEEKTEQKGEEKHGGE